MKTKVLKSLKEKIQKTVGIINFSGMLLVAILLISMMWYFMNNFSNIIADFISYEISTELERHLVEEGIQNLSSDEIEEILSKKKYIYWDSGSEYLYGGKMYDVFYGDKTKEKKPLLSYRILNESKVIFDSSIKYKFEENQYISEKILGILKNTGSEYVKRPNGDILFEAEAIINPYIILSSFLVILRICLVIILIITILYLFFIKNITKIIIRPLKDLDDKLSKIATGDLTAADDIYIKLDDPVVEVYNISLHTNQIISKIKDYLDIHQEQNKKLESQNKEIQEKGQILETINNDLENRNLKLKNILDNSNQGFFIFGKNLYSSGEYSKRCKEIFECFIGGKKFSQLLEEDDIEKQNTMDEIFLKILNPKCAQIDLYVSLLPKEAIIREKLIEIEYKVFKNSKNQNNILVILTDVTQNRELERERDKEKNILKMVVSSILNKKELISLIEDFNLFCKNDFRIIDKDQIEDILREIHTFKGNFSQFDMVNIVTMLHELEDIMIESKSSFNLAQIDERVLKRALDQDLQIIKQNTGLDILKKDNQIHIDLEKLDELEKLIIKSVPSYNINEVSRFIRELRYKDIKSLLKKHAEYSVDLANRLGKSILDFDIEGDDIIVDPDRYGDFIKSMVHIFRNAVDHGIESEEDRLLNQKNPFGLITCTVEDLGNEFSISVYNDGKTLDADEIAKKAIERGLYSKDELENMTDESIYEILFEAGFSTKNKISFVSGRGIGLCAVKENVKKLCGRISVSSKENYGTEFKVVLPKEEYFDKRVTTEEFINALSLRAQAFIKNDMEIDLELDDIEISNRIRLKQYSAFITLKGSINGVVFLGIDSNLARRIMQKMIIDEIPKHEENLYIKGVLTELINTLVGNVFGDFESIQDTIQMGVSGVIENNEAYFEYNYFDIMSLSLKENNTNQSIKLSMILVEDK